jgi:hypothetical protein
MGNGIYSKVTYRTHNYVFLLDQYILANVNRNILSVCMSTNLRKGSRSTAARHYNLRKRLPFLTPFSRAAPWGLWSTSLLFWVELVECDLVQRRRCLVNALTIPNVGVFGLPQLCHIHSSPHSLYLSDRLPIVYLWRYLYIYSLVLSAPNVFSPFRRSRKRLSDILARTCIPSRTPPISVYVLRSTLKHRVVPSSPLLLSMPSSRVDILTTCIAPS